MGRWHPEAHRPVLGDEVLRRRAPGIEAQRSVAGQPVGAGGLGQVHRRIDPWQLDEDVFARHVARETALRGGGRPPVDERSVRVEAGRDDIGIGRVVDVGHRLGQRACHLAIGDDAIPVEVGDADGERTHHVTEETAVLAMLLGQLPGREQRADAGVGAGEVMGVCHLQGRSGRELVAGVRGAARLHEVVAEACIGDEMHVGDRGQRADDVFGDELGVQVAVVARPVAIGSGEELEPVAGADEPVADEVDIDLGLPAIGRWLAMASDVFDDRADAAEQRAPGRRSERRIQVAMQQPGRLAMHEEAARAE